MPLDDALHQVAFACVGPSRVTRIVGSRSGWSAHCVERGAAGHGRRVPLGSNQIFDSLNLLLGDLLQHSEEITPRNNVGKGSRVSGAYVDIPIGQTTDEFLGAFKSAAERIENIYTALGGGDRDLVIETTKPIAGTKNSIRLPERLAMSPLLKPNFDVTIKDAFFAAAINDDDLLRVGSRYVTTDSGPLYEFGRRLAPKQTVDDETKPGGSWPVTRETFSAALATYIGERGQNSESDGSDIRAMLHEEFGIVTRGDDLLMRVEAVPSGSSVDLLERTMASAIRRGQSTVSLEIEAALGFGIQSPRAYFARVRMDSPTSSYSFGPCDHVATAVATANYRLSKSMGIAAQGISDSL